MGKRIHRDDMKKEAILFYEENKRSPYYNELSFSRTAANNRFGTWDDFLTECGLPPNRKMNCLKTKADGINLLQKIFKSKNKIPTTNDLKDYNTHKNWYTETFGSFARALYEAGLVNKNKLLSREDLVNRSMSELKKLANKLDRMPSVKEYEEYLSTLPKGDYVSRRNLCSNLNMTFVEICAEYLEFNDDFGKFGHYYINKNGERCNSLPEYDISNYLLDNGISYSKEGLYKDLISGLDAKYRYDWKLNCGTIIEYFGLYNPNEAKSKIVADYIEKTHKKIKLCQENNIKLIALYPEDTKDNYKGVKEKLAPYIEYLQKA